MVIFRRKTPFGSQVWKKKKSELTSEEKALLARGRPETPKPPGAQAAATAKDAPAASPPRARSDLRTMAGRHRGRGWGVSEPRWSWHSLLVGRKQVK